MTGLPQSRKNKYYPTIASNTNRRSKNHQQEASMNHLRAFIRIQLTVALLSCAAWGQSGNGTISGQVTDPAGSAVVGAKVTLTEPGTGQIRTAISGSNGFYTLTAIKPSTYSISVDQMVSGSSTSRD